MTWVIGGGGQSSMMSDFSNGLSTLRPNHVILKE